MVIENIELHSTKIVAGLGALSIALQNFQATVLFVSSCIKHSASYQTSIHLLSLAAGGVCSGWVNLCMNIELLQNFSKRIKDQYKIPKFSSNWQLIQYYGGIFVYVVTGILYGLMAFAFASSGALAMLSLAAGILVAIIMTIQEVETWLASYEKPHNEQSKHESIGHYIGWIIAIGNVLALGLLFTLGLAQSLMILNCSAVLSLCLGASIAFSFGAFAEYFFYKDYLSNFCENITEKFSQLTKSKNWGLGIFCVVTNGLVNAALAYAGIELLLNMLATSGLLSISSIAIPIASISLTIFAGAASMILGMDFWISQNTTKPESEVNIMSPQLAF